MKTKTFILFIFLSIACLSTQVVAQDTLQTKSKNAIYASVGTAFVWHMANFNYERNLFPSRNLMNKNYFIRARFGKLYTWYSDGFNSSLSLQAVYGERNSHLELGVGLWGYFDMTDYTNGSASGTATDTSMWTYTVIYPDLNIGYRYQKPSGGLVFRSGIGFPDGVYLSLGYAF